ncbi:hypothetical protein LTR17_026650 [Elasticomyces elasticus]|nr:hypothetical protein LTR17_026650 [Elasticomyces elasticus]
MVPSLVAASAYPDFKNKYNIRLLFTPAHELSRDEVVLLNNLRTSLKPRVRSAVHLATVQPAAGYLPEQSPEEVQRRAVLREAFGSVGDLPNTDGRGRVRRPRFNNPPAFAASLGPTLPGNLKRRHSDTTTAAPAKIARTDTTSSPSRLAGSNPTSPRGLAPRASPLNLASRPHLGDASFIRAPTSPRARPTSTRNPTSNTPTSSPTSAPTRTPRAPNNPTTPANSPTLAANSLYVPDALDTPVKTELNKAKAKTSPSEIIELD